MINKRNLLILLYPIFWIKYVVLPRFGILPAFQLRVIIYHDITLEQEIKFREQLIRLTRYWKILTPTEFEEIMIGKSLLTKNSLLITFDDGFYSARRIAESCLNPLKIKAIFFVIKNFIYLQENRAIQEFIKNNLLLSQDLKISSNGVKNMTENDIIFLLKTGHTVGAHTASHARLSNLIEPNLTDEIIKSADDLESSLQCRLTHFAYTFGDIDSFSGQALGIASSRFSFIHSGLSGNNAKHRFEKLILRDAISPTDPFYLVSTILFGGADWYFERSKRKMYSWIKK